MRTILVLIILFFSAALKAQTFFPVNFANYTQRQAFAGNSRMQNIAANKKWFVTTYSGISASYSFFKTGSATVVSVPLVLQLNRRLNNNLYAFASVYAAPSYVNFNRAFLSANSKGLPGNPFSKPGSFDIYSGAQMGLMYVNDAKTFSISGSIGIEKSSYPLFPYNQMSTTRSNTAVLPNK